MQTIVMSLTQVISFAILARIITPGEMGLLAVMSLVLSASVAIDGSAFQQSAMNFIGESTYNKEVASAIFYRTLRISLSISIPLAVAIFVLAPTLASTLIGQVDLSYLFRVLAVDLLISSGALPVAIGTLYGLKRFKAASVIGVAGMILRQSLIILLIFLMRDFVGLVFAWVISDFIIFTAYVAYTLRIVGRKRTIFSASKIVAFSWPLTISNIISFGYSWFDRALLVVFVPLTMLGVYNAATTAYAVLLSVSTAVSNTLLPVYSGIGAQDRLEGCRHATYLASRYVSFTIVPLAFGLMATSRPALALLVGQAYAGATEPLMILSFFLAVTMCGVALSPMMLALSKTRLMSGITIVSVVVGLTSAFYLLPIWGIIGASIARGIALTVSTVLTIIILIRKDAVELDIEAIWKSLTAAALMTGCVYTMQMISYSRLFLPLYAIVGSLVYLSALRILKAVRQEDIDLIDRYLGQRLVFARTILSALVLSK